MASTSSDDKPKPTDSGEAALRLLTAIPPNFRRAIFLDRTLTKCAYDSVRPTDVIDALIFHDVHRFVPLELQAVALAKWTSS